MNFSIIIPNFNQQDYLADAIESALDQTVKAEVIYIDDGSTDHSVEIAQRYPIKIVRQVNKGLASARNTGIMHATGDYILPLDADDILLENCIKRLQETAISTQADVVAPSLKNFGVHNGEVILKDIPTLNDFKAANRLGYFSAIKKSVLLEVGGYNPKMVWGYEDWDLWLDIFKRGHSLALIPEVLVLYRTKENSMLHEAVKHHNILAAQIIKNHSEIF